LSDINQITSNRHQQILSFLRQKENVRVDELSESLGVSSVTIRRDLDTLDRKGLLMRTHGGAKKLDAFIDTQPERSFFEKGIVNTSEKMRIARFAASLIQENEILFLNSGTTALFFLEAVKKPVRIITNNAAAIVSAKDPSVELFILGGEYRDQSRSFVGDFALNAIKNIHSNTTILGTNGLSLEVGLTTSVMSECSVNQAMIGNTRGKVIVLADFSKIQHVSNFVSAPLDDIDVVVTDDKTPDAVIDNLKARNIEVYVV